MTVAPCTARRRAVAMKPASQGVHTFWSQAQYSRADHVAAPDMYDRDTAWLQSLRVWRETGMLHQL